QFFKLAELIGKPEWKDDPRFQTRAGWAPALESELRPAIEAWTSQRTKMQAAEELTAAGIVAGPSNSAPDIISDPHVAARNMPVAMARTDGAGGDILLPGNPVKMSNVAEGPETRVPWLGEHTAEVLRSELGLDDAQLADLRGSGVIS